jgi:hypothetical protein
VQVLHLDVESFVIDELVQHEGDGPDLTDEGGLGLDLLPDLLLLLLVKHQLQLVLALILVHLIITSNSTTTTIPHKVYPNNAKLQTSKKVIDGVAIYQLFEK